MSLKISAGDWPFAQNLWRFESLLDGIVLDAAEVKARDRGENWAHVLYSFIYSFNSHLFSAILQQVFLRETCLPISLPSEKLTSKRVHQRWTQDVDITLSGFRLLCILHTWVSIF